MILDACVLDGFEGSRKRRNCRPLPWELSCRCFILKGLCCVRIVFRRILHLGFSSILHGIAALVRGSQKRYGSRRLATALFCDGSCTSSIRGKPKIHNPHRASLVLFFLSLLQWTWPGGLRKCLFCLVNILELATWALSCSCM